ncbi:hypothetical protein [Microbacterium sp. GXF7504]
MTEVDVRISALEAHGKRLDAVGERIGDVSRSALTAMSLQPRAFGLICSFLVPIVSAHQMQALAGFAALGAAVRREGEAIERTSQVYTEADANLRNKIDGLTTVAV